MNNNDLEITSDQQHAFDDEQEEFQENNENSNIIQNENGIEEINS
jgi:hypothetical protein